MCRRMGNRPANRPWAWNPLEEDKTPNLGYTCFESGDHANLGKGNYPCGHVLLAQKSGGTGPLNHAK